MVDVFVGFSKAKRWYMPLAWLIRVIEGTKYSHTYIRFKHNSGVEVVYEASGIAVHFKALSIFKEDNTIVKEYSFAITPAQRKQLVAFMLANAGVEYGFKQLFGIAIVRLFRLKKNPFADGRKSQVCSEVVGHFLEKIMKLDTKLDLDIAGPKDIDKWIQEHYNEHDN